ncbi:hypothetical protein [Hymenobacter chitinivorans]|uniref:Uncharacterized protein n=1 Tax=Hymenobacter chitinivorans DSM 11115 TaxID=1121954 RepID=A0A2M9BA71_9BACT|nr:hypothetical protein [Hymenobacter chitinivorans]PJJ54842.1 hypothetical protein CLV45_3188 [Hymenobacter chitinivorans DSM 11115]
MTYEFFVASLAGAQPPAGVSAVLRGLWHAGRQEWNLAHNLAQANDTDPLHNWLHAYLHRQEGDPGNAAYWYRRAARPAYAAPLAQEWEDMVRAQPGIAS